GRASRRTRASLGVGPRGDRRADGRREARSAERAPGDRRAQPVRALGGRAGYGRRTADAGRAGAPQPRVRATVRVPLRRLRQPAREGGDPPDPAPTARAHTRAGTRHRVARAGRDRARPLGEQLVLAIHAYTNGWLDLLVRWLHVIAAIAWIGSSV